MTKDKSLIFGIHPVIEALKSEENIDRVFMLKDIKPEIRRDILQLCTARDIPVQFVPYEKLKRLVVGGTHQGVVAQTAPVPFQDLEQLIPWWFEQGIMPLVLILDEVTDVRNFGAISRTAECSGTNAVVMPWKNSAQINAQTVKASAGALFSIPLCRSKNLIETVSLLKTSGFTIIGCTEKASLNYTEASYTGPVAIILGSEEYGISAPLLKLSDDIVRIPMLGSVGSLNVSVAAGVMLYEVVRQRQIR